VTLPTAKGLLVLGLSALLAACADVPPPTTPDQAITTRIDRSWGNPEVVAAWRSLGGEGAQPTEVLSATEAFAAALVFNPQMDLARAQIDVGRAGILVARQRANPVLTLSPERVINTLLGASPWVAAISLVWPVQTAGKRDLAIEQALATSDASLLSAANRIWMLRASVRAALCAAELSNSKLGLARDELSLRTDLSGRLEKQAAAGVASTYEAARTRLERDRAAQIVRQGEADITASRHDLAAVTGLPLTEIEKRTLGESCLQGKLAATTGTEAEIADAAVAARLDMRAKLAEFQIADAAWRKEIARRTPDLNLGPGYTYDQGLKKITFTISGELPIYSQNDAGIARAAAERSRAMAEAEILQREILDAVARSRDQLGAAEAQFAQANETATRTQQLLNRDVSRQVAGEVDQSAVVLSRLALVAARSEVLIAQLRVTEAIAAFEAATQAPLVPPLFDGNAAQSLLAAPGAEPREERK
jgi:outer membrane protein, heavy metal efflux system